MSFKEFDVTEIEEVKKKYAKEAQERWGETDAYKESMRRHSSYTKEQWAQMLERQNAIFEKLSRHVGEAPESEEVQALVKEWQDYISGDHYNCTKEMLAGLGLMYEEDERFRESINKAGEGTAQLLSSAIRVYCE